MQSGDARQKSTRLIALDALRGLIVILMALDHANVFIAQKHSSGEHWGGVFPEYNDALSFLTRWVTHLSAPGFFFLMGVGMVLFAASRRGKGWTGGAVRQHFIIRGLFLIALQFLLINRAWELGPGEFPQLYIGVLVALGGGMIISSFFVNLNAPILFAISGLLFVGMEFTHPSPEQWGLIFDQPLGLLLGYSGGDLQLWSNYPVLPWLELIFFGMAFGKWILDDSTRAFKRAYQLAPIFLLGFVVLRLLNGFGNIRPQVGSTWIDFLNVVKYPPAMTFTLITMGINLLLLGIFARLDENNLMLRSFGVYGRSPLFFYVLHLFLYAVLGYWLAPMGMSILSMIPYWLLGLVVLYPLCNWYSTWKQSTTPGSVLRFL